MNEITNDTANNLIESFSKIKSTMLNSSNIMNDLGTVLLDSLILSIQNKFLYYRLKSIESSFLIKWYYVRKMDKYHNALIKFSEALKESK